MHIPSKNPIRHLPWIRRIFPASIIWIPEIYLILIHITPIHGSFEVLKIWDHQKLFIYIYVYIYTPKIADLDLGIPPI